MNANEPSRDELLSSCSEVGPGDGHDPRLEPRSPRHRVKNRKALQLCAQVAETLNEALAGCGDDVLREATVTSVVPAPDTSRLLVTVVVAGDAITVQAHLDRAAGWLRGEVAAAIHRKRVPLLLLRVQGG